MIETQSYRHFWGHRAAGPAALQAIADEGYFGVEAGASALALVEPGAGTLRQASLDLIGQLLTCGAEKGKSPAAHLDSLRRQLDELAPYQPTLVNIHAGEDGWAMGEVQAFFEQATRIGEAAGLAVAFETHRGRCLFHPGVTGEVLGALPSLRIVADLSHFTCVCESLAIDRGGLLSRLARQVVHVHCRVGHEHGPQVSDPCGAAWAQHGRVFEAWWRDLALGMQQRGLPFSYCPEFGPPGYQSIDPETGVPIGDLDTIVRRQHQRIETAAARWSAE